MSHGKSKGPWVEERSIGSGGFGAVTLWKNVDTGETLALKKCRLVNEMTEKHKQRWQLEVKIMGRLEHENVIAAKLVPPELDVKSNELPLLGMEYCSGGDLRRVLNQPESCCGLREYSVRCLVHDVSGGIEYLHSKKIIHRDLKPENIVLKPVDDKIVYKIIDLGYAKELDQGSVCTSFVGTLQYLAPELFASQKYTCTVDYWSFGTVVFECITGHRPFLPSSPPVQWHREVCKKSPDDICAKVENSGDVTFYKIIPSTNRLSRSIKTYLEQWLRMMLRWDPKARGGGLTKESRPACFQMLDNVLNMKIIYLLNVSTNELLTYPILDNHTMADLQHRIEEETEIPVHEQDIIMANGMTPDPAQAASQCWLEPSEQDCFVFLFRHGRGDVFQEQSPEKKIKKNLPAAVQTIVKDTKTMIPFIEQKRAWAESVVFCEEQHIEFKRMMLSQRAAMLSLLRGDSHFVRMKNNMISEKDHMMTKIRYFRASLDHDTMFYNEQACKGGVSSDRMHNRWLKMKEEVQGFESMENKVSELEQQATALQTKIVELQKSPFSRTKQDDTLDDLAKSAKQVFQEFRQNAKEHKDMTKDHKPIVSCIVKCVMWRDKKLPDLFAHLGKICGCKADMNKLLPQVESCVQEIMINSKKILEYQTTRQTAIWKLVEIAVQQSKKVSEVQQANDVVDVPTLCRQDLPGAGGRGFPVAVPGGSNFPVMGGSGGGASIMHSLLSTTSGHQSLQAVEDSKVTNKQVEDELDRIMQEQEQFTNLLSDLHTSFEGSLSGNS